MKTALVGRGRVATHLKDALLLAGHSVQMCGGREGLQPVAEDVDVVVISISDDALPGISESIVLGNADTMVVHTAGSVPMDVLPYRHRGVLYPMQTFSIFSQSKKFMQTVAVLYLILKSALSVLSYRMF